MKTALEQAIEDLKGYMTFSDKLDIKFAFILLESYLPKEAQQIKDAFLHGKENVWDRYRDEHHFEFETPEDYFNQTFKKQFELDGKNKS